MLLTRLMLPFLPAVALAAACMGMLNARGRFAVPALAPSLLNIAETAPYGHAGSFATLAEAIAYHADPRGSVDTFDFSLTGLEQFRNLGIVYDHAEPHTRATDSNSTSTDGW